MPGILIDEHFVGIKVGLVQTLHGVQAQCEVTRCSVVRAARRISVDDLIKQTIKFNKLLSLPCHRVEAPLVGDVIDGRFTFTLGQVYEIISTRVVPDANLFVTLGSLRVSVGDEIVVLVLWRILRNINYANFLSVAMEKCEKHKTSIAACATYREGKKLV